MNIENLNKLRDHLKQLPEEKFYMADWIVEATPQGGFKSVKDWHHCGTAGCLAGWAAMLAHPEIKTQEQMQRVLFAENEGFGTNANVTPDVSSYNIYGTWGKNWLGISSRSAFQLFAPDESEVDEEIRDILDDPERDNVFVLGDVTRAMALKMLDRLETEGVVGPRDWAEVWIEETK